MPRKSPRDAWRKLKGKWVRSIGSRGMRVRLFENGSGVFYRDVWVPGKGISRKSLETSDRGEADRLGTELLGNLLRHDESAHSGVLTLKHLWERYSTESPDFLDNTPRTRTEDEYHVRVLMAYFGEKADVRHLTEHDVKAFTAKRLAGGIPLSREVANALATLPVGERTPEVEVRILKTMCRWATTVRVRGGQRLLSVSPLAGVKRRKRETEPRRPVATWERFLAVRTAMQEKAVESGNQRWQRMEFALVLAEATGRRIGSIRQLAWSDFDFDAGTIRWRAAADKKRKEWVVPMPADFMAEVQRFRVKLGDAFGGLVFPSPSDLQKPLGREVFQHALNDAVMHAKLPALGGWHSFRRKWASERKHHPLADVLATGGWSDKSGSVLIACYQQADRNSMLAVMSESMKRMERPTGT